MTTSSGDDTISAGHLEDLDPRPDPYIGQVLAERYRVLRALGGGGMGTVYEAEHTFIGRRCAIKLLHAQLAVNDVVVKRFMNEARAAALIGHPNILECTDMGRADDGSPFLVLELLEGRTLEAEIAQAGPLRAGRAVGIAMQAASALKAAHAKGIIHRDLKPENLFLVDREDRQDFVKVLDFGISKVTSTMISGSDTKTGSIIGTPHYMAPEQINDSSRVDERTDVYALGCILYQMLTGNVPFAADTLPLLVLKITTEPPPPLTSQRKDLPEGLVQAVERAMAKERDARLGSMQELAEAIRPFESIAAEPVVERTAETPALASAPTTPATPDEVGGLSSQTPLVTEAEVRPPSRFALPAKAMWAGVPLLVAGLAFGAWAAFAGGRGGGAEHGSHAGQPPAADEAHAGRGGDDAGASAPPSEQADEAAAAVQETPGDAGAEEAIRVEVTSPHRGAAVTLRRETHELPYDARVARGNAPEMLEVNAPRRQGRRFWVTLDEPRSLHVELARGRGVRDATDTQLAEALEGRSRGSDRARRQDTQRTRARRATRRTASGTTAQPTPSEGQKRAAASAAATDEETESDSSEQPASQQAADSEDGVYAGPSGDIPDSI